MRKLIVLLCLMTTPTFANDVDYNNKMIKECLEVWGMDYSLPVDKRFAKVDWNNASGCVSNFNLQKQQQRVKADREFLKNNPWFRGKNWKWEERAEYTCTKQHHTGLTVCHKPIYIN